MIKQTSAVIAQSLFLWTATGVAKRELLSSSDFLNSKSTLTMKQLKIKKEWKSEPKIDEKKFLPAKFNFRFPIWGY